MALERDEIAVLLLQGFLKDIEKTYLNVSPQERQAFRKQLAFEAVLLTDDLTDVLKKVKPKE